MIRYQNSFFALVLCAALFSGTVLRGKEMEPGTESGAATKEGMAETSSEANSQPSASVEEAPAAVAKTDKKLPSKSLLRAEAFVASENWEFDGFVAGGQDQSIKSMFILNDLLHLNIGPNQGIKTGDRVDIFKRGKKIRDPQSGKFIGYEVRHAAIARVTDRIAEETSTVRIIQTFEPVEIGDLVRR